MPQACARLCTPGQTRYSHRPSGWIGWLVGKLTGFQLCEECYGTVASHGKSGSHSLDSSLPRATQSKWMRTHRFFELKRDWHVANLFLVQATPDKPVPRSGISFRRPCFLHLFSFLFFFWRGLFLNYVIVVSFCFSCFPSYFTNCYHLQIVIIFILTSFLYRNHFQI